MKLISYKSHLAHFKNKNAIKQICKEFNFFYEESNDLTTLPEDMDILWSAGEYVDPSHIPSHAKLLFGPGLNLAEPTVKKLTSVSEINKVYINVLCSSVYNQVYTKFLNTNVKLLLTPLPIDCNRFQPDPTHPKEFEILVYFKYRDPMLKLQVIEYLDTNSISYKLLEYGTYSEDTYISLLKKARMCIWIGCAESQGFALQECLSMNVPILVLDVKSVLEQCFQDGTLMYKEEHFEVTPISTTTPHWDDRCGVKIYELWELPDALEKIRENFTSYQPRQFVLETLSTRICWERIKTAMDLQQEPSKKQGICPSGVNQQPQHTVESPSVQSDQDEDCRDVHRQQETQFQ